MTEQKHSKLPWKVEPSATSRGGYLITVDGKAQGKTGSAEDNPVIGEIYLPPKYSKANADFIVKTANSHNRLVKALECWGKAFTEAETIMLNGTEVYAITKQLMSNLIQRAAEVLTDAEGELK